MFRYSRVSQGFIVACLTAALLAVLSLLQGAHAFAASTDAISTPPQSQQLQGMIAKIDGGDVQVVTRDGTRKTVTFTPLTDVLEIIKASGSDITEGRFVGVTGLPQADGSLQAIEVHIFPPSMMGLGEGEYAVADSKSQVVTNGVVAASDGAGHDFTIIYDGNEKHVILPATVPVVQLQQADASLLKAGNKALFVMDPQHPGTASHIAVSDQGIAVSFQLDQ